MLKVARAKAANPSLSDDLKVHKPYIDAITYDSPYAKGARMRRVTEVIDCWYDSGSMPFAQWGYPKQNRDRFKEQFPAHFISEALDQTRGWFYSQLAISTMLFGDKADGTASTFNENYPHPEMPEGSEEGIRKGLYLLRQGADGQKKVQLLGSGAILREALAAANILEQDFGVMADVWSATSFTGLRRDGVDCARGGGLDRIWLDLVVLAACALAFMTLNVLILKHKRAV